MVRHQVLTLYLLHQKKKKALPQIILSRLMRLVESQSNLTGLTKDDLFAHSHKGSSMMDKNCRVNEKTTGR